MTPRRAPVLPAATDERNRSPIRGILDGDGHDPPTVPARDEFEDAGAALVRIHRSSVDLDVDVDSSSADSRTHCEARRERSVPIVVAPGTRPVATRSAARRHGVETVLENPPDRVELETAIGAGLEGGLTR